MSNEAIYVYDPKGQYQAPLFTVYNESFIEQFIRVMGFTVDDVHVTRTRLHPYDRDRYKNTGGDGVLLGKSRVVP